MELCDQIEVISNRTSMVERPREGPLGHRKLEKRRLLKEIKTNWLNVVTSTRLKITV